MNRLPTLGLTIGTLALAVSSCSSGSDDDAATVTATDPSATAAPPTETSSTDPVDDTAADTAADTAVLDTSDLAARLDSTLAGLTFEEGSVQLDDCPTDVAPAMIAEMVSPSLLASAEISTAPEDINSASNVYDLPINGAALAGCYASANNNGVGLDVSPAASSVDSYLREFNDPENIGDLAYDVIPVGEHRGGELFRISVDTIDPEPDPDSAYNTREVLWINDEIMVSAYVYGPVLIEADIDQIQATLLDFLPSIIDSTFT